MDDRICSTPGCDREAVYRTRKLCRRCYNRATHKPRGKSSRTSPLAPNIDRFVKRIRPGDVPDYAPELDPCWEWTGHTNRPTAGYPVMDLQGRVREYAHRWSYTYFRAEIPDGLEIDHLCRNIICVNPWHLEPVTPAENMRRLYATLTHCPQGHPYTPDNTYIAPGRSGRQCKICRRAAVRRSQARNRRPTPIKDFCKHGHPLSGDNLAVSASGKRICRECRRAAARISNAKRWGHKSPKESP